MTKEILEGIERAEIAYAAKTDFRQRYYANDHHRDTVVVAPKRMPIANGREMSLDLDREGAILVQHHSMVEDFENREEVAAKHPTEIVALLLEHTGADEVLVTSPGILRFSEKSGRAGSSDNSNPARFAHVDTSRETARSFAEASLPEGRKLARYAHYNVWRAFSCAPQDVGLAICDAGSVDEADLLTADAIFDPPGGAPEWGFDSYLLAHNPAHRWFAFPDMTRDEAIIFKTSDSQFHNPAPHVAFDNPAAPPDAPPRASIEMRAVAYWYA
ncbi:CmcJ/NvfI family oxidoreductase [Altererythrobacter sp.]|uniref:CmcJ/NvfI family oxidoreductase n=1 Tax=Altererythrobacter sp. TaxID=1872480 RepID=UPI003D100579